MTGSTDVSSPLDALDDAVAAARTAFAAAADLAALAAVKPAHLGDRAPVPLARREIGALPGPERADAGRRVNAARLQVQAAFDDAARGAGRGSATQRVLVEETVDVTLPWDRRPRGARHPLTLLAERIADVFVGHGLGGRRGPRARVGVVQLRRAELRAGPPGAHHAGHVLRGRDGPRRRGEARPAHAHLAGAGRGRCWSASCRSTSSARAACSAPTSSTRPTRRCSTRSRAWPWTRASRWRTSRAPSTTSPARCSAPSREDPAAPVVLPVHRAVAPSWTCGSRRRRAARAGSSGAAAAWSTRTCCAPAASTRTSTPASRSAWASSARCMFRNGVPDMRDMVEGDVRFSRAVRHGSVSMRVLHCPGCPSTSTDRRPSAEATAEALVRVGSRGRGDPSPRRRSRARCVVGRVLDDRGAHRVQEADPVVPGRCRRARRRAAIVCGARNFAVGDLVVVALPGRGAARRFAIAARKTYGHVSDGMICSARELGLGDDHAGILVLPPRHRRAGRRRARRCSAWTTWWSSSTSPRTAATLLGARARPGARALATDVGVRRPGHPACPCRSSSGEAWPVTRRRSEPAAGRFVARRGARRRPEGGVAVVDAAPAARGRACGRSR